MCSSNQNNVMTSYLMKMSNMAPYFQLMPSAGHLSALDFHRFQMINSNPRIHMGIRAYPSNMGMVPYGGGHFMDSYSQAFLYKQDYRGGFVPEEPKPNHSYIALISMAILGSKDEKLVLGDIYQWILDNYSYFRNRGTGWRNSIRHNLSLNECFVKCGRSANGKGHYWAIHEANVDDFKQGDFRRRRAQRKVRRYMGLATPGEDEDEDSPTSSPTPAPNWAGRSYEERVEKSNSSMSTNSAKRDKDLSSTEDFQEAENEQKYVFRSYQCNEHSVTSTDSEEVSITQDKEESLPKFSSAVSRNVSKRPTAIAQLPKKRLFDIDSLLAPNTKRVCVERPAEVLSAENKLQWTKLWAVYHKQFSPEDLKVAA